MAGTSNGVESSEVWAQLWPELAKGLPAAIVALLIGYIAWRQYQVARAKLNLDLFERRDRIYDVVRLFLQCHGQNIEDDEHIRGDFFKAIPKAFFLFGPEIGSFMILAKENAKELAQAERIVRLAPRESPQWTEARANEIRLDRFFDDEETNLRDRFGPYMDFTEWRRTEMFTWVKAIRNTEVRITVVR